jgi:hypothetical protein
VSQEKVVDAKILHHLGVCHHTQTVLVISFAVLDNPEPLYLLELLGQTAFFGTPWGTQEYPRYRFNWLNTQHVSDAEEKVMRIKTGGCASFDPTETRVEPFNTRLEKRETNV